MKNEYQEALDRLKLMEHYQNGDEYEILQELVDKETPMKPTLKRGIHDIRCSKCGNPNLNTKWTYGRYCSGCGQRVLWED